MDAFTVDDLRRLTATDGAARISIYLPTFRTGKEVRQNALRFKNLIRRAEQIAEHRFPDRVALRRNIERAAEWIQDHHWWQHQGEGLAVFLDEDRVDRVRMPRSVDENVYVGSTFHILPLLATYQGDGRFHVLAVSQKRVRLLEGSKYSIDELEDHQLPSDLRSALNIDEYQRHLQQHSTGTSNIAGTMLFHGQGGGAMDVRKRDEIQTFFQRIDNALEKQYGRDNIPLVFAGVDYLFPICREASHYRMLIDQSVAGNMDDVPPSQLHDDAWQIVAPRFAAAQDAAVSRMQASVGSPMTVRSLPKIVRAARQAAIDTLLVAEGREKVGVVNEQSDDTTLTDDAADDAEELLNYSAVYTLAAGGTVYSVPSQDLPDHSDAMALLRLPLPTA